MGAFYNIMSVTIKLHYEQEIFRFSLENDTPFSGLVSYAKKFYLQGVENVTLRYVDDEGDLVLLTTDGDWDEAKRIMQGKILHVHASAGRKIAVSPISRHAQPAATAATASTSVPQQEDAASAGMPALPEPLLKMFANMAKNGASGSAPEQLFALAQSPQAQQVMQSLGINPDAANGFLSNLRQQQASSNDNNICDDDADVPEPALCQECLLPFEVGHLRWKCSDCPEDFEVHGSCKKTITHDATHLWTTNYASEENIQKLIEVGGAPPRDVAIEILNANKGSFEQSLSTLCA